VLAVVSLVTVEKNLVVSSRVGVELSEELELRRLLKEEVIDEKLELGLDLVLVVLSVELAEPDEVPPK
jgi:hypothetical protein